MMKTLLSHLKSNPAWPTAAALAIVCLVLALKLGRTHNVLETCEADNANLREQLDVANMAPLLQSQRRVQPSLSDFELRRLQARGLRNPVFDLLQDLASRADLIPADAFFGGTMHIIPGESYVLTDRWVLAGFEDGHVRGNLWLEYDVGPDGRISWRVLGWYMN
ncbi:MAG TPA: hypothetical protein ENN39_00320 [Desulfonatronum sp.]|nr:hypothetical protein [Desulfonatronum sp.]